MDTTVTVITITRHRVDLLERAIRSVRQQDWGKGELRHLIIADDCQQTAAWLHRNVAGDDGVVWESAPRQPHETSGPSRLARLRNAACKQSLNGWIAFLDDDNEFEPHHVRTLLASAEASGCPAIHSYRKLFHFDGSPFLEEFWPFCRNESEAQAQYREYVAKGIMMPGSNVARERPFCDASGRQAVHIDMNVWLVQRQVLIECAMSDRFTEKDWIDNVTEDDKLLEALTNSKTPIATSGVPSVRYYLGGYSNNFQGKYKHSEVWDRPSIRAPSGTSSCTNAATAKRYRAAGPAV